MNDAEKMTIAIVGHVDHGKSTLVGRLMADTGVVPEGKVEIIRAVCEKTGKPFEYAFLLDALKDERVQGITIDAARCFFRSEKRRYLILDAPGHIEFLKNMVTGAARAEAAVLVIDAQEGVRENSRRHGYYLSMLGIRQLAVCVNKMDLVGWDRAVFDRIVAEFTAFLEKAGLKAACFIPVSARDGDNLAKRAERMPWYSGPTALEALDAFTKDAEKTDQPLRLPVQDVYRFTESGDNRRIIAGRIEAGGLRVGDAVLFSPSNKRATIRSLEGFPAAPGETADAGQSVGLTLNEQSYIQRGEIVSHEERPPKTSSRFRASLFWLGRAPLEKGKPYKLKLATAEASVQLESVVRVLDSSSLEVMENAAAVASSATRSGRVSKWSWDTTTSPWTQRRRTGAAWLTAQRPPRTSAARS